MRPLLLSLVLAACATAAPHPVQPADFAASVRSGALDAENFDFAAMGFWDMDPAARETWYAETQAILRPAGPLADSCDLADRRALAALAWNQLAAASPTADEWRADADALRYALTQNDALIEARARGESDAGMNENLQSYQRAMLAIPDGRAREVLRRVIRDQSRRLNLRPPEGLPERAGEQWGIAFGSRLITTDCDNTRWLREQLAEITWFDIPTYGDHADRAAWLIAQHADRTPEFQREVLARLESLPAGHTSIRNLAHLFDRVATAEGRPQRYGTQMHCDATGAMVAVGGLEDETNIDSRRAAAGLPPFEEYRALMARVNPCNDRQ